MTTKTILKKDALKGLKVDCNEKRIEVDEG